MTCEGNEGGVGETAGPITLNSRGNFIRYGLQQAGLLLLVLLLLSASGVCGLLPGVIPAVTIPFLSGPFPMALLQLDVSNKQLWLLWILVAIGYWCMLGAGTGWLGWNGYAHGLQEQSPDSQRKCRRLARRSLFVIAFIGGVLAALFIASSTGMVGGGPSIKSTIINNLRQVDGAIQQFALEKKLPANAPVKEADILPYLRRGIPRVGTERYILKTVADTPYAVLESDWRIRRSGWREGYTIPKGTEYHLQ